MKFDWLNFYSEPPRVGLTLISKVACFKVVIVQSNMWKKNYYLFSCLYIVYNSVRYTVMNTTCTVVHLAKLCVQIINVMQVTIHHNLFTYYILRSWHQSNSHKVSQKG